ncbi:MAG: hypothetical protein HN919_22775 [Verrucomicrobia bacterium]|jgi:hypothetical protein|nr:hypothetical protein [Verrucomicrobiota bacterium]MBT7069138.1 hypothetical protein [Verrucomicrobiota bacterium]MBT7699403.1 hypothetical protein [Verrucomicrobiota bacterium]
MNPSWLLGRPLGNALRSVVIVLLLAGGVGLCLFLAAGCASTCMIDSGPNDIAPETYQGWEWTFRLQNDTASVVIVPQVGRMMHLGLRDGVNVLRNDPALLGKPPLKDSTWTHYGGDWLWPVAQSRWPAFNKTDWPPPAVLCDAAWEGRAWREPDGRQSCLLTRHYGAPINAVVMRQFTLDPGKPLVTVQQRIVATADVRLPLTLWSITQLDAPQQVFFPVRATSAFKKGYKVMMGDAPPGPTIGCREVMAVDLIKRDLSKIGMDAPVPWIAARQHDVVTVVRARHPFSGAYPDGGCSLQLFAMGRGQYAEIETLSPEFHLRAGESRGNTLTIELLNCHPGISPCRLADRLRPEEK